MAAMAYCLSVGVSFTEHPDLNGNMKGGGVMFKLDQNACIMGCCGLTVLTILPSELVKQFGKPKKADDRKISGRYVFKSDKGDVFELHDWKQTNRYCTGYTVTPTQFWKRDDPQPIHICGRRGSDLEAFIDWLSSKLDCE